MLSSKVHSYIIYLLKGEYLSSDKVKYHFYIIQICQILKCYIRKVDLNVYQKGAKWFKDSRNAYHTYRVPAVNLTLYIFGPTSSHIYPTGQNEVPLEPQRPNEDFGVSHTQIKHS